MPPDPNCIFCKIIDGSTPSKKVYEDEHIIGVLDINPGTKGHVLLMPKEHIPIMPVMPPEIFKHMFGKIPAITLALKRAMLTKYIDVFIANGAVAGQQSPHFMIHLLPRDDSSPIDYSFHSAVEDEVKAMLGQNVPIMMKNHFARSPAEWQTGKIERGEHLARMDNALYEDEKALVVVPEKAWNKGHVVVYSQEGDKVEDLSYEGCSHLFYTASYVATALFEGLGAQGSNIILNGQYMGIHVLPRFANDGLNIQWSPMKEKPNMDELKGRIHDEMFLVEKGVDKPEEKAVVDQDAKEVTIISDEKPVAANQSGSNKSGYASEADEIEAAIVRVMRS